MSWYKRENIRKSNTPNRMISLKIERDYAIIWGKYLWKEQKREASFI